MLTRARTGPQELSTAIAPGTLCMGQLALALVRNRQPAPQAALSMVVLRFKSGPDTVTDADAEKDANQFSIDKNGEMIRQRVPVQPCSR